MDAQELANMVVNSCYRYDHRWAEYVCRYCNCTERNAVHSDDCEINEVQRIANGEQCEGA